VGDEGESLRKGARKERERRRGWGRPSPTPDLEFVCP